MICRPSAVRAGPPPGPAAPRRPAAALSRPAPGRPPSPAPIDELAGAASRTAAWPGARPSTSGSHPGDHRNPEPAGDDRRVRAAPPATETAPASPCLGQLDQVGRRTSCRTRMKSPSGRVGLAAAGQLRRGPRRPDRGTSIRPAAGMSAPGAAPGCQLSARPGARPPRHRGDGVRAARTAATAGARAPGRPRSAPPIAMISASEVAPGFRSRSASADRSAATAVNAAATCSGVATGVADGAVGDDQQHARRRPVRHRHTVKRRRPGSSHAPAAAATSRSACRISADDAAPGSSCPTLRGPR